jgi:hypothetical protein
MLKFMIKFIHSTGIDIMEIEPEWLDPTSEQEFQIMLEQINTKNKNRDKFPIRLNWTDYIPYLLKKRVSESLNILRMERNKILQSTDWVLTHDNALSLLNLDDWIQYRKNLRDFFESPFQIIFKEDTNELDRDAMKFPPVQPPILRK